MDRHLDVLTALAFALVLATISTRVSSRRWGEASGHLLGHMVTSLYMINGTQDVPTSKAQEVSRPFRAIVVFTQLMEVDVIFRSLHREARRRYCVV